MQVGRHALFLQVKGRNLPEYAFDGKAYIAGVPDAEYAIRLVNRSAHRTKYVLSVDGLSAVDGKPAAQNGAGYILGPWSCLDVPGWRLSDAEVAAFRFQEPGQSYAAAVGRAENVGVVACAIYEEEPPPPTPAVIGTAGLRAKGPGILRCTSPDTMLSNNAAGALGGSLGTGFGGKAEHAVTRVEFRAKPRPVAVLELRYEDAAILRGLGIDVADPTAEVHSPVPFPADAGYCTPPKGWRG